MTDIPIWQQGVIKNGIIKPFNRPLWIDILNNYNDKEVEICIRERKKKVSLPTHAYYRGVILPICEESEVFSGFTKDKLHQLFANMFLKDVETIEVKGKIHIIETIKSTSILSQKKMNEFIDKVINFLAELEINIPQYETTTKNK